MQQQESNWYTVLYTLSQVPVEEDSVDLAQSGSPQEQISTIGHSLCCLGTLCDPSFPHSTSHTARGYVPQGNIISIYYQKGRCWWKFLNEVHQHYGREMTLSEAQTTEWRNEWGPPWEVSGPGKFTGKWPFLVCLAKYVCLVPHRQSMAQLWRASLSIIWFHLKVK